MPSVWMYVCGQDVSSVVVTSIVFTLHGALVCLFNLRMMMASYIVGRHARLKRERLGVSTLIPSLPLKQQGVVLSIAAVGAFIFTLRPTVARIK